MGSDQSKPSSSMSRQSSTQSNVPSPQFSGTFTWHDVSPRYLVSDEGHTVRCIRSGPITVYSKEVFRGTAEVEYTLVIRDLQGGPVAFGLFSASRTDACRSALLGSDELGMSVGCGVGGNNVVIAHRSRVLHQGRCNSSTPVFVTMKLRNGRVKFSVDGDECECAELSALDLSSGEYRLGCSMANEGQCATLKGSSTDGAALLAMLLAAAVSMHGNAADADVEYDAQSGFTFRNNLRNIDADGAEVTCKRDCKLTVASTQWFKSSNDLRVTARVVQSAGAAIGFGLFPHDQMSIAQEGLLGDQDLTGSVGCFVMSDGTIAIHFNGELVFRHLMPKPSSPCDISVTLRQGVVSFDVNGKKCNCPKLATLTLSSKLRLGVTLVKAEQVVRLLPTPGALPPTAELVDQSTASRETLRYFGLTNDFIELVDKYRSVDIVSRNPDLLVCQCDRRTTVYSRRIFRGSDELIVQMDVVTKGTDFIGLGVLLSTATSACNLHLAGEKEITKSVSLLVNENVVGILHQDRFVFRAEAPTMSSTPVLLMRLQRGRVSFRIDGHDVPCSELAGIDFSDCDIRVGAALSQNRQAATITRLPTMPSAQVSAGSVFNGSPGASRLLERLLAVMGSRDDEEYALGRRFTFRNNLLSIDALDEEVKCNRDVNATVVTKQWFKGNADFRVTLRFVRREGATVAFGVVDDRHVDLTSDKVLGDRETATSVGCVIAADHKFTIRCRGEVVYEHQGKVTAPEPEISLVVSNRKIRVEINRVPCLCGLLMAQVLSDDAKYRLAVTLVKAKQVARLVGQPKDMTATMEMHDRWRSIDVVSRAPDRLKCVAASKVTVYSKRAYERTEDIIVELRVATLGTGVVALGLLNRDDTDNCANEVIGSSRSVSLVLLRSHVGILYNGKTLLEVPDCDLKPEPTIVMRLAQGKVSFTIDGRDVVCSELCSIELPEHVRVGVSLTEQGQEATISRSLTAPTQHPAGPPIRKDLSRSHLCNRCRKDCGLDRHHCRDCPDFDLCPACFGARQECDSHHVGRFLRKTKTEPYLPYDASSPGFTFRNDMRSIDVLGDDITCNRELDATVTSTQWFPGTTALRVTLQCLSRRGGIISFGLVPRRYDCQTEQLLGDSLFPGTVGFCVTSENALCVRHEGRTLHQEVVSSNSNANDFEITLILQAGRLSFEFNGRPCTCAAMSTISLADGAFRLGISMNTPGQHVRLAQQAATRRATPRPPDSPASPKQHTPIGEGDSLPMYEEFNSIQHVAPGRLRSRMNVRCSIFSMHSFPGRDELHVVLNVVSRGTEFIGLGIIDAGSVKETRMHLPGDAEMPRSVSVLVKDQAVVVRHNGSFSQHQYFTDLPPQFAITMRLSRGRVSFDVAGRQLTLPEIDLGPTELRVAVAMCEMGQEATIARVSTSAATGSAASSAAPRPSPQPHRPSYAVLHASHHSQTHTLLTVGPQSKIAVAPSYKPPKGLGESLLDSAAALAAVPQLPYIVEESTRMVSDMAPHHKSTLTPDEALALTLYTFDLGSMGEHEDGSDNFYCTVNTAFRTRAPQLMLALRPFIFHFNALWPKLPPIAAGATFYRGVDAAHADTIRGEYTEGRVVQWSGLVSLTPHMEVAKHAAQRGGVVLTVTVRDARNIAAFSNGPYMECVLRPDSRLVVVSTAGTSLDADGLLHVKLEQQA